MKIVTVIGARPQFVKAAVVSRALQQCGGVDECIVHTGQHYDEKMSRVFFDELNIPAPRHQLHTGSGRHGEQTGRMLADVERVLLEESPSAVLVYGDTNSTLAGGLAAAKLHIPVAHVEAGLRSFNRRMPEEVNRVLTDHLSTLLFCPTDVSVRNLRAEGIVENVHLVGDVMYDCATYFIETAADHAPPLAAWNVEAKSFALLTCHRAENTDDPERLAAICRAVATIAERLPVVFPVHPRTRKAMEAAGIEFPNGVRTVEPASYLEMLQLERAAAIVLTDSGGVQKEAFILGTPCVTLRDETEWEETVECGANTLAGADTGRILEAVEAQLSRTEPLPSAARYYGGGEASRRIAERLGALSGT